MSRMGQHRSVRCFSRGQNLVELALTLPFVLIMVFAIVDFGRAWITYESAKVAANEGVHAASEYHNSAVGQALLTQKLQAAGLTGNGAVTQVQNQHAYQVNVTVQFTPLFASMVMPLAGANAKIIPTAFPITYSAVDEMAIY